ncbi:hypothetical protein D4764_21G0007830, partial [Takifugu flavidus]
LNFIDVVDRRSIRTSRGLLNCPVVLTDQVAQQLIFPRLFRDDWMTRSSSCGAFMATSCGAFMATSCGAFMAAEMA